MTMTNQALINAIRARAVQIAPNVIGTVGLLQLAQVAALCTLAEDRVSAENRQPLMDLARQNAAAPTK